MNNQIQLVLKSSTTELSLNDRELGIYLTPELEGLTGLPEIRTTSGVNAGYDGGWTSAQNYDARSITIRGVIANEDVATVEQLRRQLTTLAGQGKNEELTLDLVTQAGKAYTIQVRTIALEMSLQKVLTKQEFMLQLRADDPLVYDASETTHEALLRVAQATGGFTIDFELPLAITGSSEETIVNNEGLEQVPTVTRMYGELHNPKIINQTTNQFMQIEADLGFAEGEWTTPSEPVEGKNLTINGAPENAPLSDFTLKGNTEQQTYTGKNLFNYTTARASYSGLSTTINDDGTLTTTGVPTGNYIAVVPDATITDMLEDGATYTVHHSDPGNYMNLQVAAVKSGGGTDYYINSPFTVNKTTHTAYRISVVSTSKTKWGTSSRTITASYQLEKGSQATSFEPYVGGTASPNPDYPQAVKTVTGENVVKICGKNLFDSSKIIVGDIQNANTTIRLHSSQILWLEAGTYTFSTNLPTPLRYSITTTDRGYPPYAVWPTWDYNSSWQDSARTTTFTLTKGGYFNIQLSKPNNATLTLDEFTPYNYQLELGSTATPFEPYQGQSYEVNLGKNLLSSAWESGKYSDTGEKTPDSSAIRTVQMVAVEPYSTYIVSNDGNGVAMNVFYYRADGTYIACQTVSGGNAFTTGGEARFVNFYRNANVAMDKAQLERGSSITSYAPYFAPIELCKIGDYQDYIYKSGGKWYVHKVVDKLVLTGSESNYMTRTNTSTTHSKFRINSNVLSAPIATTTSILCTNFVANTGANAQAYSGNAICGSVMANFERQLWFSIDNTIASTVDAFKTWVTNNTPTVYYALATPTDTEITNEALIGQLEAILQEARMYNPQANITTIYANGNEQGTLSISYFTDKNPDTRDELVIDSRLRTITLNGLDVYHLQAPGSEFLMLAPGENRLALQSDITGDNGYAQVSYKQGYLSI